MKKISYLILSLFVFTIGCAQNKNNADKLKFPKPIGYVNDFENILTATQINNLSKIMENYEKKTSNQIVIVTTDSILPYHDMRTYAKDLGNEWGVGQKGKDNGLIILFSRKLRADCIATGSGTEKILTDSIIQNVRETIMVPEYSNAEFYEGLKKGLEELIKIWGVN